MWILELRHSFWLNEESVRDYEVIFFFSLSVFLIEPRNLKAWLLPCSWCLKKPNRKQLCSSWYSGCKLILLFCDTASDPKRVYLCSTQCLVFVCCKDVWALLSGLSIRLGFSWDTTVLVQFHSFFFLTREAWSWVFLSGSHYVHLHFISPLPNLLSLVLPPQTNMVGLKLFKRLPSEVWTPYTVFTL